ncbi:MAG TPA: putative Ig domain-containing protein, partial [Blastocatellia bacterium]|nr:putative Ig domain-containing protein [Blastocatellia bacterium]HMZ19399.1 putative Ig domain-containing protein [Blastocatellia bacterium]HNG34787.1 putative Ig domain-containing protein [Blastocatellia bacterium]
MKSANALFLNRRRLSFLILLAAAICFTALRPAQFVRGVAAMLPQSGGQDSRAARLMAGDAYEGGKAPAPLKTPNTPAVITGVNIYAYNFANHHLLKFDAGDPGTILSDLPLTGLAAGEYLEGMDFRPLDGQLYAEVSNSANTLNRLVRINTATGACTQVGAAIARPTGVFFGLDFNPVQGVENLQQVSDADENVFLHAQDGSLDFNGGTLAYATGDAGFGANPNVVHVAFNNNFAGAQTSTLYGIDSSRDTLVTIGDNIGNGRLHTVGPLGVDVTAFGGFDIARYGSVYAVLRVAGVSQLFTINLNTGAATLVGAVGGAPTIDGIAIDPLCSFNVTPATVNVVANGGTNSITLQTNGVGCGWTASSNVNWITVNGSAGGIDSGQVTFTTAANASGAQRTGTLTIAGKTVTVTQAAAACTPTVVSYSGSVVNIPDNNAAGVNINLNVANVGTISDLNFRFDTAGTCDATVGNTNAGVTHTFVGDLVFKLTSPQGTTVTLMNRRGGTRENICLTTLNDEGGLPALSSITGVTGQSVAGDYAPDNPLSAFDGQNANGTWILNVSDNSANDTGQLRRFSLVFNQECAPPVCSFQAAPTSFNLSGAGGNGTINVTTQCAWTTLAGDPWIVIDSGVNSSGNGTATFHVTTNFGAARTGTLTVAGQTINISQDAQCTYQLSPQTSISAGVAGGSGSVDVVAGMGCPWTAVSNNPWLNIISGSSGAGAGTVNYSVQPNNGNAPRTGTLTIGGQTYTVTQAAAPTCNGNPPVTVSYNGPAVAIPDNVPAGVNIPLLVSGVGTITDLNFRFDTAGACDISAGNPNSALDHTHIGDLTFKLTSPSGTTVTFMQRRGSSAHNICQLLLNDDGLPNISTFFGNPSIFVSGNYAPEAAGQFLAFDGQNANGTWILNVSDNAAVDTGNLRRFSLIFNTCDGCNYQLSTNGYTAAAGGGQSTVDVTCGGNCTWAAQSNANWIGVNNGASGNGNGTVSFTVAANAGGQRNGTLTIAGQTFTVTQAANCGLIIINPALLPAATVGTQYTQPFGAQGGTAPYSFNLGLGGSLPPGLSIVNGVLTGAPSQAGSFPFSIQAIDINGCTDTKQYTLIVNPPCNTLFADPLVFTDGTQGTPYSNSLSPSGGTAPYSFTSANFSIPGLTLNANGTISGTPTTVGLYNFTSNITDANGCTGSSSHQLKIVSACNTITVTPATLPPLFVNAPFSQQLTADGGTAPYTFSLVGQIGLSLSPSGLLSGTPNGAGQFAITANVTDANGCTGSKVYFVTITGCPTITVSPNTLPAGMVGTAYNQQLTASGGTGPYNFNVNLGTLPTGMTLSAGGLVSGTPTQAGSFNFTAIATDANNCTSTRQYAVTINAACATITLTPATAANGQVNQFYTQQFTASGGTGPYDYFISAGALPNGVTLSTTGIASGTPTAGGQFNFTVSATDANGCTGAKQYALTINVACPTININPLLLPNGQVGVAYNQTLTAGGGAAPYNYSISSGVLPNGLTLSAAGVLSGTPTESGQFNVTLTVTDANGCTAQRTNSITITACPTINVGPTPPSPAFVGVPYQHTFNATGGTAPYTYSLVAGSQLLDGLTLSAAGVLSGTPTGIGGFGSSFTIKATDANGCTGQAAFGVSLNSCPTITVNPSNSTLPAGQAGTQYNQNFTQTGGAGTATFTITAGALPNGLSLAPGGALTGTPTAFGDFNFTVKATDTNGCASSRAYSLHINAPCATITVNPTSVPNGTVGTAYNQTATATGGTAPYTYSISAGALPGGVTLASGGGLTGTPNAAGTFNFTVKATDTNGCMGTRAYTVTINGNVVNSGLQFYPLSKPLRLLDTRAGQLGCDAPGAQIQGNTSRTQLARRTC